MVVARSPVQDRAHAERLPEHMPHHVLRPYAFGRTLVVRTAGGMNVMIARIPTARGWIDPAAQPEIDGGRRTVDRHRPRFRNVFGTAPASDRERTRWKAQRLAVGAIDLFLKEEVRRKAFGPGGVDAADAISDDERSHRRAAVLVADPQRDVAGRLDVEE